MSLESIIGRKRASSKNSDSNTENRIEKPKNYSPRNARYGSLKQTFFAAGMAAYLFFTGFASQGCGGSGSSPVQSTGAVVETVPAPNPPKRLDRLDTAMNDNKITIGIVAPDPHPEYTSKYQLELYKKDGQNYVRMQVVEVPKAQSVVNTITYDGQHEFTGLENGTSYKVIGYSLNSQGIPSTYAPSPPDMTAHYKPKFVPKSAVAKASGSGKILRGIEKRFSRK